MARSINATGFIVGCKSLLVGLSKFHTSVWFRPPYQGAVSPGFFPNMIASCCSLYTDSVLPNTNHSCWCWYLDRDNAKVFLTHTMYASNLPPASVNALYNVCSSLPPMQIYSDPFVCSRMFSIALVKNSWNSSPRLSFFINLGFSAFSFLFRKLSSYATLYGGSVNTIFAISPSISLS